MTFTWLLAGDEAENVESLEATGPDASVPCPATACPGTLHRSVGFTFPATCAEITCPATQTTLTGTATDEVGDSTSGTATLLSCCAVTQAPAPCPTCAGGLPLVLGLLPLGAVRRRRSPAR